jgi:hypothetical protein
VDPQGNGVLVTSPSTATAANDLAVSISEIAYWTATGPPTPLGRSASFRVGWFSEASYRP